ncbi:D-proline reductase (dithiol) proprotein PrdA [Dethiosulfovibrio sp. F2B]|uniref:D-proline reductase (dithiol) proprotein PrdA n=1 Tax=Dethiosulfovibrio faecalis TaxID=2720018 RepID=UPI001F17E27B|nr:D-proline reductase (dithiol) proprotein PrdA [Dethiosulfovibrio faecalis]MCF4151529.1 D-proline reductase (dithiol) proprotein PrdA [Dethiosulfovibrio faecalis]
MSIDIEQAKKMAGKPAIVCCRTEEGTILESHNLEDPAIFPDLEDSGLLTIPSNCHKIGEILGAKLLKTIDSLTPLTPDLVEGAKKMSDAGTTDGSSKAKVSKKNEKAVLKVGKKAGEPIGPDDLEDPSNFANLVDSLLLSLPRDAVTRGEAVGKKLSSAREAFTALTPSMFQGYVAPAMPAQAAPKLSRSSGSYGGTLRIKIEEGRGIDIELPLGSYGNYSSEEPYPSEAMLVEVPEEEPRALSAAKAEPKEIRSLVKKHFNITEVSFGDDTKIDGTKLYIRKDICDDAVEVSDLVKKIKIDIITPELYDTYSETLMDIQPIATKENDGKLGTGVTRVLDNVVMVITGTDENGVQIGEFGSSEGILQENILWNRPGAPDKGDIMIKTEVVIEAHTNMERRGPFSAHRATEFITNEIRMALKDLDESLVVDTEEFKQVRHPSKKKVVIVKEIMGQGAMHDNLILPEEPVGMLGGHPNIDLGNLPVMLSPLEVLDGGIHALTCIGPASKECSRHYWREPLVLETLKDEEMDLCGVILIGSPQINSEKFYVSERLGMTVEALDVDGAIVTTEGFGNNHIDFASHIEQIGMRGIPVVGMSFCAMQGALVVGNPYMTAMVDLNKSDNGIENEILGCNTLCREDAVRALEMLRAIMNGEEVMEPERKWNPNVKESNLESIEEQIGMELELVPNENSIPVSDKRREKYMD